MSTNTNAGAYEKGDTTFRRTWDKDEYAQKAKEREAENRGKRLNNQNTDKYIKLDKNSATVKARDQGLDFDANVNKTVVLTAAEEEKGPGFRCALCDVTYKDNLTYLDHLNGPQHAKNAGTSTFVERSTVEQVRARLLAKKVKTKVMDPKELLEMRVKEEAIAKKKRKEEKKRLKNGKKEEVVVDESISELMGFGGFTSSKK
ncbi:hypothetical protein BC833DRAFT_561832 [Globomyces pollinis-pini]|nr:hypothetical protein BC833DRAFT_561832 [Globomyces pollinis-pini]KAJ2998353.1 hypothetical protein HDV02_004568 [Globomyces sp. JEL0801]